ncbi:MAG: hypothetical protein U9N52_12950 [Campylobacterota bacterium]|nr:hypothetical protein [Campylobacterota bacterium]
MVQIPEVLIDRADLNLLQRALIPLIIRHTFTWGSHDLGVSAKVLSDQLTTPVKEVISALDALVSKNILQTQRQRDGVNTHILYGIHKELIETINNPSLAAPSVSQTLQQEYHDATYYLNLSQEKALALESFALSQLDENSLSSEIYNDFNLYQRSRNNRSFDWRAEFLRWMHRELAKNPSSSSKEIVLDEYRPSAEQFAMTEYFISKLSAIDPQFESPFDVMSWAKEIKYLMQEQNYTLDDIKSAIDWLFSAKGDWFRPNVPDASSLRKHFKRIISNTRSYRDGVQKLPDNINIFDLYEQD